MLEPLNFDNIPNFADIDPNLKNPEYDPENLYSVPYMWGLLGVIDNSAYIDPAEKDVETWDILWDEELSGDILMFNNSRDAIGIALKKLGYSYNTEDPCPGQGGHQPSGRAEAPGAVLRHGRDFRQAGG